MRATRQHSIHTRWQPNLLVSVLVAAIWALQASCGTEAPPAGPSGAGDEADVSRIDVAPSDVEVRPGERIVLSATALDSDGQPITGVQFEWLSSDPAVASVAGTAL
jgi:protocatechuate 3,4-dioxygenase beta subunit